MHFVGELFKVHNVPVGIGLAPVRLPRYIIGTEVPIPGGATAHEEGVSVTKAEDVRQTIQVTREAFLREGLESAWERVVGVVVQPGVEFGDDFVLPYQPSAAKELSKFIESQPMVYEAHSTDYQTREALTNLVRDHFAILKVGPGLTFAFREAVFALAMIENELFPEDQRSNIIQVLDDVMVKHPEHWKKYYHGDEAGQILVLRPQPIHQPGAQTRADQPRVAAIHQQQRRLVVGHVGVHGADHAQVIGAGRQMRKDVADLDAALAVLLKAHLERKDLVEDLPIEADDRAGALQVHRQLLRVGQAGFLLAFGDPGVHALA